MKSLQSIAGGHLALAIWIGLSMATADIPKPTDAPKSKTPKESAAAFKLPSGFKMEVVASEPLIASPTGFCWDERGGMFVCELHGYNLEGQEVGPDLIGQLGMAEEGLLKDILMPNDRIRPGYETTVVKLADGSSVTGILRDDGATSLAMVLPNGVEPVLLRKDVTGVRRLETSLMPSFAEGLAPNDVANILAWLRSRLKSGTEPKL